MPGPLETDYLERELIKVRALYASTDRALVITIPFSLCTCR